MRPRIDRVLAPEPSEPTSRLAPSPELVPEQPREQPGPAPREGETKKKRRPTRKLSQDLSDDDDESSDGSVSRRHRPSSSNPLERAEPHRALRVSKRTHKAILFTLEEALRGPFVFSPDFAEELAEMADVRSGLEPPTSNGNGAHARPRPAYSAASPPTGIRTPRMILRDHEARQAARRAEQEQIQMERDRLDQEQQRMQRARADEEARALEDAERRNAERRAANAAAAGGSRPQRPTADPVTPVDTSSRRRHDQPQPMTPDSGAQRASQQPQARPRRGTAASQGAQQQHNTPHTTAGPSSQQPRPQQQQPPTTQPPGATPATGNGKTQSQQTQPQRTSFPHAFERWEALSAQWEGLTSHWIRRLELNASVFDNDPVSQQLSRQVTDLSAAGANLFHAVVELQRLRASSERKFQRWFFETRADLEKSHETNAIMESQLEELRGQLNESHSRTHERDSANSIVQKQLSEMKKELAISKDESRRAWEELGRREQLERERTLSLQAGQPTIVGGVQVVPMVQSASAASRRDVTRDPGGSGPEGYGEYPQAPPGHPVTTTPPEGSYYREAESNAPQPGGYGQGSEGGYSEGEFSSQTRNAASLY